MVVYTAITFSPVQGFIEKSRKLRDLYGASLILSYLSKKIVDKAQDNGCIIISPGLVSMAKGMPNRILIEGNFPQDLVKQTLFESWKKILWECKQWIERKVPETSPDTFYHWHRDWEMWATHTWEYFWGQGDSITTAMEDLENRKLSRDWVGINWIGESSSLTGTDAIAWNGLGSGSRNPKTLDLQGEKEAIDKFYERLSAVLEGSIEGETEGKVLDLNERLSIPELVKRLITLPNTGIPQKFEGDMPSPEKFTELVRKQDPINNISGQWTGWFMGDGDKVGNHLKELSQQPDGAQKLKKFSEAMRQWGENLSNDFPKDLGRIIYAGGDDFLGVVYSKNPTINSSQELKKKALEWLLTLKKQWEKHGQKINLSVGFVWVAGSVPQRDVLQHCREAEKVAKAKGRDRITIRIVFNSGQYVQWTTPWDNLGILQEYQDRNKGENWGHIYNDLAQLKARHAIIFDDKKIRNDHLLVKNLLNIYFNYKGDDIFTNRNKVIGENSTLAFKQWADDLVQVGWQLCC